MFLNNYSFIIILIIIIICGFFILLSKKNEQLVNKESFLTTREGYSALINGITAERLFHAKTDMLNLLIIRKSDGTVFDSYWEDTPFSYENRIGNSKIRVDDKKGVITGLNPNKTYKVDIIFDFYNINIGSEAQWKFVLKKVTNNTDIAVLSTPINNDSYELFTPNSLESYSSQYNDFLMNSFFISNIITKTTSFSLFMSNVNGVDVKAVTVENTGTGSLNSSISISLIEI